MLILVDMNAELQLAFKLIHLVLNSTIVSI